MTPDDECRREQQDALLRKLGFSDAYDLLTKDLRVPANDEAQVTPVHRVGVYKGGF
jgi:hypothetical protein